MINSTSTPESLAELRGTCEPEAWLEEHGNILFKFAMLRVKNAHVAEDLVQEVLVKAFAAFGKFRGESSVRSWLFQILRNEISNHYRKRKKEKTTTSASQFSDESVSMGDLLRPQVSSKEFATAVERDEFWDMIQICFEKIPEHLLEAFLCRLSNPGERIESLCKELDLNSSNFSVRLFRARLMLRKCVERTWLSI